MTDIPREDKKVEIVTLRISTAEKAEWQAQADEHGVSVSRLVRHVVNEFCNRQKKRKSRRK